MEETANKPFSDARSDEGQSERDQRDALNERKAELDPELKSSSQVPLAEEKTSVSRSKVNGYNGLGRRHNDEQMDEILDWYLLYDELPTFVSERQRRDYRKHPRLELRRMYLEQAGYFKKGTGKHKAVSKTATSQTNVLDLERAKAQRERRASGGV